MLHHHGANHTAGLSTVAMSVAIVAGFILKLCYVQVLCEAASVVCKIQCMES